MLNRLSEWLTLTNAERNVIAFLVGTFLLGLGIRLYQETFPGNPTFDYRSSDSTFAALNEASQRDEAGSESDNGNGVDINKATKAELTKLPGIGEVIAGRIIAYRRDVGPFRNVSDLRKVKGINAKKFEQIRNLVAVKE